MGGVQHNLVMYTCIIMHPLSWQTQEWKKTLVATTFYCTNVWVRGQPPGRVSKKQYQFVCDTSIVYICDFHSGGVLENRLQQHIGMINVQ